MASTQVQPLALCSHQSFMPAAYPSSLGWYLQSCWSRLLTLCPGGLSDTGEAARPGKKAVSGSLPPGSGMQPKGWHLIHGKNPKLLNPNPIGHLPAWWPWATGSPSRPVIRQKTEGMTTLRKRVQGPAQPLASLPHSVLTRISQGRSSPWPHLADEGMEA